MKTIKLEFIPLGENNRTKYLGLTVDASGSFYVSSRAEKELGIVVGSLIAFAKSGDEWFILPHIDNEAVPKVSAIRAGKSIVFNSISYRLELNKAFKLDKFQSYRLPIGEAVGTPDGKAYRLITAALIKTT
jgi:hypothetical protein